MSKLYLRHTCSYVREHMKTARGPPEERVLVVHADLLLARVQRGAAYSLSHHRRPPS